MGKDSVIRIPIVFPSLEPSSGVKSKRKTGSYCGPAQLALGTDLLVGSLEY